MEFRILGPLEVRADGAPVPIGGPRQRALLALLLLNANRAVSRDQLIDELVGDGASDRADHALHVQISRLRKTLAASPNGAERIAAKPPGYLLHVRPGELDLRRFEELVAEGRQALESAELARAAETFRAAELLWCGRPLADLEFEPFAKLEIERLEELRLVVVEERIDAELAIGHHARLVPELERLVSEHPLRERLRGQQMLALYRSGRQVAALETFRAARSLLNDELGLEPSPQLRELERAILRHEDVNGADATWDAPTRPSTPAGGGRAVGPGSRLGVPASAGGPGIRATAATGALELPGPESAIATRRRRSGLLLLAFAAALIVAGTAVAAIFVGSSHPAPKTLREVPADAVGIIDTATNRLVDAVSIGGRVRGLAYGGGSIWAGNYDGRTLVRIDPATARIVDTVALPGRPTDIVYAAGRVWVSSASADLLIRIDPRYGTIDRRIRLHQAVYNQGMTPSSAPLAAGDHGVWIGHDVSALSRIDSVRATPVKQLALDAPVVALAYGPNDVWAVTGGMSQLVAVDPISNSIESSTPLPGSCGAVAVGPQAIWVASADTNEVWRVDPITRKPTAIVRVGGLPLGIALGTGSVWTANRLGGTVSRIDQSAARIVSTIHVGNNPLALTVVGKRVWVAVS